MDLMLVWWFLISPISMSNLSKKSHRACDAEWVVRPRPGTIGKSIIFLDNYWALLELNSPWKQNYLNK
jgi:hypothetical protein